MIFQSAVPVQRLSHFHQHQESNVRQNSPRVGVKHGKNGETSAVKPFPSKAKASPAKRSHQQLGRLTNEESWSRK